MHERFLQTVCAKLPQKTIDLSNQQIRASTVPYVVELIRALGD